MQTIVLDRLMPQVFVGRTDIRSELWGHEVELHRGEVCLVEAQSGLGKSSLCSFLIGYRNDYSGTLRFDNVDARTYGVDRWSRLRQQEVSCMFQELRLFPELTALENVMVKNQLTRFKTEREICGWFDRLDIGDKLHVRVGLMSFGQQQRVAMMRALVQPMDFLLLDEPVSHLDDRNAAVMASLMMEEVRRQGAGVVATSVGKHIDLPYDKIIKL